MIDIAQEINNSKNAFLPDYFVDLLNSSLNGISKAELTEVINSRNLKEIFLESVKKAYGPNVSTVEKAFDALGKEYCFILLLNVILKHLVLKEEDSSLSPIFEMQIFTASSGYFLAKISRIPNPYLVYISGLLSNISYFYISSSHPREFRHITETNDNSIKRMTSEWEIFGLDHAEISYILLRSSGLNSEITEPVRYHHQKTIQRSIGTDNTENSSLCIYFGSVLTNIFYEDLNLATEFRKDIKSLMNLYSDQLEDIVDESVDFLKICLKSLGITGIHFPGYFKIITRFDTQLAMISSEFDMTQRKIAELNTQNIKYQKVLEDNSRKLVGIALLDPLTGAFNRRFLDEKLHDEFLKAKRYGINFTLISCDIDHFKNINDTYGHGFGDTVLVKLVTIIKTTIRKTDYIARVGGEEFVIVCHSPNGSGGFSIAEKVRKVIENSVFEFQGNIVPVTMSFGVADYYPEVKSAEELVRISDERLYKAKNSGRNKVIDK